MNKIILLVFVVGTTLAQYPSPNYSQGSRGGPDVSSAYSQRGGQYANGGPGGYGARNAGPAGYSAGSSGSYAGSNSAAIYSNSNGAGYKSNLGANPAAYAGLQSGSYAGAANRYPGANQGAYNGQARAGYNGGVNYNNGAAGYRSYNGQDDLSEPAKYEFKYDVFAPEFYNEFGHTEQRDGDYTSGTYYVLLPDGRRQVVEYTADQDGYKPKISYTEPTGNAGQYNRLGNYNGQPGAYNSPAGPYNAQGPNYNGQVGAYAGQGAAYNGQAIQQANAYNRQAAQGRIAGYGNGNRGPSYQQQQPAAPSAAGY